MNSRQIQHEILRAGSAESSPGNVTCRARVISQSGLCHNEKEPSHGQPKHSGSGLGCALRIPNHQRTPPSLSATFSRSTNSPIRITARRRRQRPGRHRDRGVRRIGFPGHRIQDRRHHSAGRVPGRRARRRSPATRCRSPSRAAIRKATTSCRASRWSGPRTGRRWRRRSPTRPPSPAWSPPW